MNIKFLTSFLALLSLGAATSLTHAEQTEDEIIEQLQKNGYDRDKIEIKDGVSPTFKPYLNDFDYYKEQAIEESSVLNMNNQSMVTNGVYNKERPLVLEGDIEIHGPVVIESDLILKDVTISGTGVLYTTRNVHVFGNVESDEKPDYNKKLLSAKQSQYEWTETKEKWKTLSTNKSKGTKVVQKYEVTIEHDQFYKQPNVEKVVDEVAKINKYGTLGIAAKGNIIIGDLNKFEQTPEFVEYLNRSGEYIVDTNEGEIANGYINDPTTGKWHGDYTKEDGGFRPSTSYLGNNKNIDKISKQNNNMLRLQKSKNSNGKNYQNTNWYDTYGIDGEIPIAIYDANKTTLKYETLPDGTKRPIITDDMVHTVELVAGNSGNLKIKEGLDSFDSDADFRVILPNSKELIPRKYYEPTMSDMEIAYHSRDSHKSKADGGIHSISAVMLTNHFYGGYVPEMTVNGSMISHSRGFKYDGAGTFYYDHRAKGTLEKYSAPAMSSPIVHYRREL